MKQFDEDEVLDNEDRRDILRDTKTSFVPEIPNNYTMKYNNHIRKKRSSHQSNVDINEYLRSTNPHSLDWKVSI